MKAREIVHKAKKMIMVILLSRAWKIIARTPQMNLSSSREKWYCLSIVGLDGDVVLGESSENVVVFLEVEGR